MIDSNEDVSERNIRISKQPTKRKICDPIILHHKSENEPNTYTRSSKRIDFISQFITRSGILPFDTVPTPDRRGLYNNINLNQYQRDLHQFI